MQERLAGTVTPADGNEIPGPPTRWIGRRHGPRKDRRWASSWSPEQIARLPVDFPDDGSMRISHEAIYQALYVQGRSGLKRELTACLRTGRALRVPRARTRGRGKKFVTDEVRISQQPAEAEDHWDSDLIIGLNSSAIGTRFTMLLHLPPLHTAREWTPTRLPPSREWCSPPVHVRSPSAARVKRVIMRILDRGGQAEAFSDRRRAHAGPFASDRERGA